jgi:TfoX N-terminal domain
MPYSEQLARRVREALVGEKPVREIKMMGGLCFMLRGHMVCGVHREDLIVRVGAERQAHAMARPHARPMDITGRPLKGFIFVDKAGFRNRAALESWLRPAIQFVSTLPRRPR